MDANPTSHPIKVLLIDDHTLFRNGIKSLLHRHSDLNVIGDASDGVDGVKRAQQLQPDVVLLDLNMPGMSGLQTLQLLLQDRPGLAVIMLTVSEEAEDLADTLEAGARGYLPKNIETEYLMRAIRRAYAGEPVLPENMASKLVMHMKGGKQKQEAALELAKLTPREREILTCLARGESNKVIARQLDLAESTVKIHVQNILKKLNLTSRVQAAVFAVENRLK